jgi:D-alanyl-D-alanine carboxypeptidase/D-alanyl-D-alanine-endopeptidase (penicillin-binding protein 4)
MASFRFRAVTLLVAATAIIPASAWPQAGPVASGSALQGQLNGWFARASRAAPGRWGIAVATQSGQLLWAVEPTRPLVPASTVKLFTTGFARSVLGGEARRETRVLGVGHVDQESGTWIGTWALELNGDPTFERPLRGGPSLSQLAEKMRDQGIRRLVGPFNVVSAGGTAGASWPAVWNPRHKGRVFAPLIGALTLNENTFSIAIAPAAKAGRKPLLVGESPAGVGDLVEIRAKTVAGRSSRLRFRVGTGGRYVVTGTIGTRARTRRFTSTAHDPRAILEASWARALRGAGIAWQQTNAVGMPSPVTTTAVLATVASESFDSIASEVNRRSLNIGAELMLLWAGGNDRPADRLTAHVQQITGDYTSVHLVDGSGLSHDDRASPLAFVNYLAKFPLSPGGRGFSQLLPANGSGTLRKLSKGLPGPGVVRAKTGTLVDVATLAGYLGRVDGVLLISLMYNGPRVYAARQEQWRLLRLLGAEGVLIPQDSSSVATQLGGDSREPAPVP